MGVSVVTTTTLIWGGVVMQSRGGKTIPKTTDFMGSLLVRPFF